MDHEQQIWQQPTQKTHKANRTQSSDPTTTTALVDEENLKIHKQAIETRFLTGEDPVKHSDEMPLAVQIIKKKNFSKKNI
jgi:hypothetical protein